MSQETTIQRIISIDDKLKEEIKNNHGEESQVIVHCHYEAHPHDMLIRIWPTTFLIDVSNGHKSTLLFAENISIMPDWSLAPANRPFHFTLYFTGLSRECSLFDLVEEISQPGAFIVRNIPRNKKDIYHVYLKD